MSFNAEIVLGERVEISEPESTRSLTSTPLILGVMKILSVSSEESGFNIMLLILASLTCGMKEVDEEREGEWLVVSPPFLSTNLKLLVGDDDEEVGDDDEEEGADDEDDEGEDDDDESQ